MAENKSSHGITIFFLILVFLYEKGLCKNYPTFLRSRVICGETVFIKWHFRNSSLSMILVLCYLVTMVLGCQSIYKGKSVDITAAPFMLSFMLNGEHVCGAAVLSPDWAVTAAHCVWHSTDTDDHLAVRSGSSQTGKGGVIHNVTERIFHPEYNDGDRDYDIAVLKITPQFEMSNTTEAIELPNGNNVNLKTSWGQIVGWGAVPEKDEDPPSKYLRYARVPKIKRRLCAYDYDPTYILTPRQVCYGYRKGGPDTCQGDSGGPLYNDDNILLGITSWGDDCQAKYAPGVYMDIRPVSDWIRNVTDI